MEIRSIFVKSIPTIIISKYMKKRITIILFAFISVSIFAQKKVADYSANIKQANLNILEQNYGSALQYLLKAYHQDSLNSNVNYLLGLCYLESVAQKNKALPYLEFAAENVSHNYVPEDPKEKKAPENTYKFLGIAYRLQNHLNESNTFFTKYRDLVGTKNKEILDELDRQVQMNITAVDFQLDHDDLKVINLGDSINTEFPEYNPVVSSDESTLYFTGRRADGTGNEKSEAGEYYEDIFLCKKKKDGTWSRPRWMGANINSVDNEAVLGISADGLQLFVGRDVNEGDIYLSKYTGFNWGTLTPLSSNINTKYEESFATVSKDGNTLYFVSARKEGGLGGKDIWSSTKQPDGTWSVATNLGPVINTTYDEESPYITPDGKTLYFSSKGHQTMGGYDVFKSVKNSLGNWTEPVNLKPPVNTTDDDLYYSMSSNGMHIYFSSARKGGKGDRDLYMINLEKPDEKITLIEGVVTFDGALTIPDNVHITATDDKTNTVDQDVIPNKTTGKYVLMVHPGKDGKTYKLNYSATGFQPFAQTILLPSNSTYNEIEKELQLKKVNLESKTPGTINISGSIRDNKGKPIIGSQIVVKNNFSGLQISINFCSPDSGSYYFILKSGENYNLTYEAEGYLFQSENINVPKQENYSVIKKNIVLEKLETGAKIVLNNIFFDSNKSILRAESNSEIDKVYDLMQKNPSLIIEVDGHTDNQGNASANLSLSQARSQSVVNAIVKKGIDGKHLKAKGFGATVPIAPNALPDGKPNPVGMQLNRRVELKIIQAQ